MSDTGRARPAAGKTSAEWRAIERHFEAAVALPVADRRAYLERECGDDAALREAVQALLDADTKAPSFLDGGAVPFAAEALDEGAFRDEAEDRPSVGGPDGVSGYRLLEEIGRGGMGRVFLAEAEDDRLRRRVAVKRMAAIGRLRRESERRFLAEGRVLAALDHPNIARVFDAGVDARGDPFLVMELVDGAPITDYCGRSDLDLERRLELFLGVCSAVQHAHEHLVVHRDLKPSNILVTKEGQVKLLDFGIAKLLDPDLLGHSAEDAATRAGLVPMTPEYAAPEQVRGGEITTATDVYALGRLLYELLTLRPPYRVRGLSPSELERVVCEVEPSRPSTRVPESRRVGEGVEDASATLAAPRWLPRLRGDLDSIVLKALAKPPERRYRSAHELARDLRRFRQGLPVEARPPTLRYRVGKLARRHRAAITAAAAVAVGIALLIGFYTLRLQRERDQSRIEAHKAEQVAALLAGLFEASDPTQAQGEDPRASEILRRGAAELEIELVDQPEVRAELLLTIGRIQRELGLFDDAGPALEDAERLLRAGEDSERWTRAVLERSRMEMDLGDYAGAERRLREHLEAVRGPGPEAEHRRLLVEERLAEALLFLSRLADAEQTARRGLERIDRHGIAEPLLRISLLRNLGAARELSGDLAEAAALLRRAVELERVRQDPPGVDLATILSDLGMTLGKAGELESSEGALREAQELVGKLLGEEHAVFASTLQNLAINLSLQGRVEEAVPMLERSVEVKLRSIGAEHPSTGTTMYNLAHLEHQLGHLERAEGHFLEARRILNATLPPTHRRRGALLALYGDLLLELGRLGEAETLLREALSVQRANQSEDHVDVAVAKLRLGRVLTARGRLAAAEPLLEEALPAILAARGDGDNLTQEARVALAEWCQRQGDTARAEELVRIARSHLDADRANDRRLLEALAALRLE